MQPREAFRIGFLARCVEEGLSPEDTRRLAKSAASLFTKEADSPVTLRGLVEAAKGVGYPTLAAAAIAPPAIGGLTAYLNNSAQDVDATDIDEIKQRELAQIYRRMSEQLRRKQQLRQTEAQRKPAGNVLL